MLEVAETLRTFTKPRALDAEKRFAEKRLTHPDSPENQCNASLRKIIEFFAADLTTGEVSNRLNVTLDAANYLYDTYCKELPTFSDEALLERQERIMTSRREEQTKELMHDPFPTPLLQEIATIAVDHGCKVAPILHGGYPSKHALRISPYSLSINEMACYLHNISCMHRRRPEIQFTRSAVREYDFRILRISIPSGVLMRFVVPCEAIYEDFFESNSFEIRKLYVSIEEGDTGPSILNVHPYLEAFEKIKDLR